MNLKNVALYVSHSDDGYVDDDKKKVLKNLAKFYNVIFAYNGFLLEDKQNIYDIIGNDNIEYEGGSVPRIVERENFAWDMGMHKWFILEYEDFIRTLNNYLITNDSYHIIKEDEIELTKKYAKENNLEFTPLKEYNMDDLIKSALNDNADFYGATIDGLRKYPKDAAKFKLTDIKDINNEYHIQSYFINIKKSLLSNDDFYNFWKEANYPINRSNAILNIEIPFTKYYANKGYRYNSYCNEEKSNYISANLSFYRPELLIIIYSFPLWKNTNIHNYKNKKEQYQVK